MEERRDWYETNLREAGEVGMRKAESMRSRKGGQNFSIERILGRVRDGQEGEERQADQEEEEGEEQEIDEDQDDEEEDKTNEEYQLKKEHVDIDRLLGLSPSPKAQPNPTSNSRMQPILPRPPPPLPPSTSTQSFFPTPSPFSQDPFLLTPLQSPRYSFMLSILGV